MTRIIIFTAIAVVAMTGNALGEDKGLTPAQKGARCPSYITNKDGSTTCINTADPLGRNGTNTRKKI